MEKFFFKRVEVWAVMLVVIFCFITAVLFGAMVRNVALGHDRFGRAGHLAYTLASAPANASKLLERDPLIRSNGMGVSDADRFDSRQGWTIDQMSHSSPLDGYLLFSRYDGDAGHHTIELLDLTTWTVEHRVNINADILLEGSNRDSNLIRFADWNTTRFRATHPFVLPNGDLMIKDHSSPLLRTNACGSSIWRLDDDLFHHSLEAGPDGALWTSTHIEPTQIEGLSDKYHDDSIASVSFDGEVTYSRSLTEVMLNQGYGYLLFSNSEFNPDPIHVNDVQPVLSDGPFWQKGDVFLSLRHLSMIVLFRPSADEIVWMKQGPWSAQHDVDVIDDHTIAVFNNNMLNMGGPKFVDGTSNVLFYDFISDTVSSPYNDIFEKYSIRTVSEGQFSLLDSGHLLVEESDAGRYLIFAPDGSLVNEFVNRAEDGLIYHLGWSRYIERDHGDKIRDAMKAQNCI